ncbi:MAG: hypothetical protein QOJ16_838 [Acidobacteriota bacterium]|jgi:hypothetical protein|nr:hypothetical protein [Acidobacteriota bacterium]
MKKKDQAPQQGSRTKSPRRLTLNRETIQSLNDPLLAGVLGAAALARHTFTQANGNDGGNAQGDSICG